MWSLVTFAKTNELKALLFVIPDSGSLLLCTNTSQTPKNIIEITFQLS